MSTFDKVFAGGLILTFVVLVGAALYSQGHHDASKDACNKAGFVYVNGQCGAIQYINMGED